jgi:hypothetical protein
LALTDGGESVSAAEFHAAVLGPDIGGTSIEFGEPDGSS